MSSNFRDNPGTVYNNGTGETLNKPLMFNKLPLIEAVPMHRQRLYGLSLDMGACFAGVALFVEQGQGYLACVAGINWSTPLLVPQVGWIGCQG